MNLDSEISRFFWLLLLVFCLRGDFTNASDDDNDDESNAFGPAPLPQEDEALRSIRDYIDLLTVNWNGLYNFNYFNSQEGRLVLNDYLNRVSAAYESVLYHYNNNHAFISSLINTQLMIHVAWQMQSLDYFNFDSPVLPQHTVANFTDNRNLRFEMDYDRRRERWLGPQRFFPLQNNFVSLNLLERTIRMRNPYFGEPGQPRVPKPYLGWTTNTDPDPAAWPGLNWQSLKLSWNHFVPYKELNYLFRCYNRLWVQNNLGRVRYADLILMQFEIRLARLSILRQDLRMNAPYVHLLLTNDRHYTERAAEYNAWSVGNIFIGLHDNLRFPTPSKNDSERFETQPAEVLRSDEWAREGFALTRDIQTLMATPENQQNLDFVVSLLDRYHRMLQNSGSTRLWAETGQGVLPASPDQYELVPRNEVFRRLQQEVSDRIDKERPTLTDTLNSIMGQYFSSQEDRDRHVNAVIDRDLKEKLYSLLEKRYFNVKSKSKKKNWQYKFTIRGDKNSKKFKNYQKTGACAANKVNVKSSICGNNLLLGASTSTNSDEQLLNPNIALPDLSRFILSPTSGSTSDIIILNSIPGGSNQQNNEPEFCGTSQYQENVFIDPVNILANPVRPDLRALRDIADAYTNDAVQDIQEVILDECENNEHNGTDEKHHREKRMPSKCSMEVIKEYWSQCEKSVLLEA